MEDLKNFILSLSQYNSVFELLSYLIPAFVVIAGILFSVAKYLIKIASIKKNVNKEPGGKVIIGYGLRQSQWKTLIGRSSEVNRLSNFVNGGSDSSVCIVSGMGGTGKTELVNSFAHKLIKDGSDYIDFIIFVSVVQVNPDDVLSHVDRSISILVGDDIIGRPNFSSFELHQAVVSSLGKKGRGVIIIDNWDNSPINPIPNELLDYGCKIVITTRSIESNPYTNITLKGLSKEDASKLFKVCVSKYERDSGREVLGSLSEDAIVNAVKFFGGNPLAIYLIVPVICESSHDLTFNNIVKIMNSFSIKNENLVSHIVEYTYKKLISANISTLPLKVLAVLPGTMAEKDLLEVCKTVNNDEELEVIKLIKYQIIENNSFGSDLDSRLSIHPLIREHLMIDQYFSRDEKIKIIIGSINFYVSFLKRTIGNPRENNNIIPNYRVVENHAINIFYLLDVIINNEYEKDVRNHSAIELIGNLGYFFRVREYWDEADRYWSAGYEILYNEDRSSETALRFYLYKNYMNIFRGGSLQYDSKSSLVNILSNRKQLFSSNYDLDKKYLYNTASIMRLLALSYKAEKKYTSSLRFLHNSYVSMDKVNDNRGGIARVANDLGDILMFSDSVKSRLFLDIARENAFLENDVIEKGRSYRLLGDWYFYSDKNKDAVEKYEKAINFLSEVGLPDEQYFAKYGLNKIRGRGNNDSNFQHGNYLGSDFEKITSDWLDNRPRELNGRIVKCIVLDWSGVLVDEINAIYECQSNLIYKFTNERLSFEKWKSSVSLDWVNYLLGSIVSKDDNFDIKSIYKKVLLDYYENNNVGFFDYVKSTLDYLKSNGYILVVYSAQVKDVIDIVLRREGVENLFDYVISSHDKPSMHHVNDIKKKFELDDREIIFVDDMNQAISFYRSCNLCCIGVISPLSSNLSNADHVVRHVKDIIPILDKIDTCRERIRDFYENRYGMKKHGDIFRLNTSRKVDNGYYQYLVDKRVHDDSVVLDIGCGIVKNKNNWRKHYYGVDISWNAISLLGNDSSGIVADAVGLPIRSSSIDCILFIETLEHLCPGDDWKAVAECHRVLMSGGTLILSVPNKPVNVINSLKAMDDVYSDAGHIREYSLLDVIDLLEKSGFMVEKIWSTGFFVLSLTLLMERKRAFKYIDDSKYLSWIISKIILSLVKIENMVFSRFCNGIRWTAIASKK